MSKGRARVTGIAAALAVVAALLASCSEIKPKTLGSGKLEFDGPDTSTPDTFKFNFAFRDATAASPLNRTIYLQGASNTKTSIISVCNSAGTNCVCEFLDSGGEKISETDHTEISYDTTGNYIRCQFGGTISDLTSVRVRNQNSTITSSIFPVDTTLTVQKLLGDSLDVNRVRTIYRYSCLYNFLQKQGTSVTSFDCSHQPSQCWFTGTTSGDFCLLQSSFSFHLFSDNYSTNFTLKVADRLYNQGGSDRICGLQIKQFDCAGAGGIPVPQFALFGEQTGIFDTAIQLAAGPDISLAPYGFAARTSTFLGETVCPPGMVRRAFFRTFTDPTGTGVSSNYPAGQELREIAPPDATPAAVAVNKVEGGDCDNISCSLPTSMAGTLKSFPYAPAPGTIEFCVIPISMLP